MTLSGDNLSTRKKLKATPFTGEECKYCGKRAHEMYTTPDHYYDLDAEYLCEECAIKHGRTDE